MNNAKIKRLGKVNIIETSEAYRKILYWFFSFPYKQVTLNELAKNLKIAKTTANRIVLRLIKEDFLKREIIGKSWRIHCNSNHPYNKTKKISFNLEMIFKSKIIEEICKKFGNSQAIILFGSYRKGDDIETSDIDIAVELLNDQKLKIEEFGIIEEFGYRKKIMINLHIFSRKNININLFSNIANGIVIDGFLEVKK